MTETMTADDTEQADWSHITDPQATQNLPATADPKQQFSEFSLAVRRMLGLEDASDGEIELFFHVCQKSGLDPFNKEVYMIGRNTEVDRWEPVDENEPDGQKRRVKRWVTKYTIQTSINGFRKKAREIANQKAVEYSQDDPLWCGEDGIWKEVWPESKPPVAAKFVVYRDGHRYSFIAHYAEYVQTNRDGGPNSMWKKMPCNQIRKCAEAGAIQAAFPDELGGLLLDDAVQNEPVVIDEDGNSAPAEPKKRQGGQGVGGLRDRAQKKQQATAPDPEPPQPEVVDGEVVTPDPEPAPDPRRDMTPQTRKKWENRMFALFKNAGIGGDEKRGDQLAVITALAELPEPPAHRTDPHDEQLRDIVTQLNQWEKAGTLVDEVAEIVNAAAIDAAAAANTEPNPEGTLL